jgi:hypothetical protein
MMLRRSDYDRTDDERQFARKVGIIVPDEAGEKAIAKFVTAALN